MHKRSFFKVLASALLAVGIAGSASAFSASSYASQSRLATGRWVKISVEKDGVYQLTADELSAMGFSDINAVRVYGSGGHMINEVLDGSAPDDLVSVPFSIVDGKLVFYGQGPVTYELNNPRKPATRHYSRVMNTYATTGYYFLTEDGSEANHVPVVSAPSTASTSRRDSSITYFHHEQELVSLSKTGKDLVGEDMPGGYITIDYSLPGLAQGDSIMVKACAAGVMKTSSGYINAIFNGVDRASFKALDAVIYTPASTEVYYNTKAPMACVVPTVHAPEGKLQVYISNAPSTARLDYVILTYERGNDYALAQDGQFHMGVPELSRSTKVSLANASANTIVWDVTTATDPKMIALNADGDDLRTFTPGVDVAFASFVAFNPADKQLSIGGWEEVANQNIHGAATPELLIVTNKHLQPQAERLAQLHRDHDGIDVLVLTQEQVFNEFSSGTPDAMAYRLMNKMFYDRDRNKFKNFLLFGGGSYDNRNLLAKRDYNILTYQSDESNDEELSYVSDDFFGILDDNSGYTLAKDLMRIGVGRITSDSPEEARTDVDKVVNYVLHPDFGPWRNSNLYTCDADDQNEGLHTFQAEGICNTVTDYLGTNMAAAKVYTSQYPRAKVPGVAADRQTAVDGNSAMKSRFNEGQYFMTYVGHAGTTNFTKQAHLWSISDAAKMDNPHLPIMTTACCNVARYDSDVRGIAEVMFHNPKGGVIATLTSTRSVYAEYNDDLNQAWCNAMFSFESNGYMATLGEVLMKSKQAFGTMTNRNKMSFLLLGDPAIKVNYPKPYFQITSVGGVSVDSDETISISPLQEVEVVAQVLKADKSGVNTDFNGDGYVTIYGEERYQTSFTQRVGTRSVTRDIYYPREVIAQVKGRVVNGIFTANVTLPRDYPTNDSTASIKVYAHMDNSEEMVNGCFDEAVLAGFDPEKAITDEVPPVISAMYLDDEDAFAQSPTIYGDATLYISASDNRAFNVQSGTPVGQMKLVLDNGVKTLSVKDFAVYSNESKNLDIAFPLSGLETGKHTLQYTVFDIAGNSATRTITFYVEALPLTATFKVQEKPAVEQATFRLTNVSLAGSPTIYLKVLDTVGNVVFSTTTTDANYAWDLKDNSGKRLPAGVYRYYASFELDGATNGSDIGTIVVVDPVNTANSGN